MGAMLQPEVVTFKTETMAALGAEPKAQRRTVSIDLREDWPAALRASGFDETKPSAWSAEGLLMYLPPEAQDRLFDHITGLSAPRSQLACEYLPDMSVFGRESLRELFEQAAVDVRELVYSDGDRSHVPDHLRALGWASTLRTAEQLYTANGRHYPDSPELALFADVTYLRAELD